MSFKDILQEIDNSDLTFETMTSTCKSIFIVEGDDDEKFYSCFTKNVYTVISLSKEVDTIIDTKKCVIANSCGSVPKHKNDTIKLMNTRDSVISICKKYEKIDINGCKIFGIVDSDFRKNLKCSWCTGNLFITKGQSLENHIFLPKSTVTRKIVNSFSLNENIQLNKSNMFKDGKYRIPLLDENLNFDYNFVNKSPYLHNEHRLTEIINETNQKTSTYEKTNFLLLNWTLKSGGVLKTIDKHLTLTGNNNRGGISKFIYMYHKELFPDSVLEDFIYLLTKLNENTN